MTRRRDFVKTAAGLGTLGAGKKERNGCAVTGLFGARQMVRRGLLGAIHFCRIAHPGLRDVASYILDWADCVIEIEPDSEGTAFLGSRGTLVVRGGGWRVFAQES
jgi:hypothetical protein